MIRLCSFLSLLLVSLLCVCECSDMNKIQLTDLNDDVLCQIFDMVDSHIFTVSQVDKRMLKLVSAYLARKLELLIEPQNQPKSFIRYIISKLEFWRRPVPKSEPLPIKLKDPFVWRSRLLFARLLQSNARVIAQVPFETRKIILKRFINEDAHFYQLSAASKQLSLGAKLRIASTAVSFYPQVFCLSFLFLFVAGSFSGTIMFALTNSKSTFVYKAIMAVGISVLLGLFTHEYGIFAHHLLLPAEYQVDERRRRL